MRIAIKTLPLTAGNYGGTLQAYALQRVLRELGHDVTTDTRVRVPQNLRGQARWLAIRVRDSSSPGALPIRIQNEIIAEFSAFTDSTMTTMDLEQAGRARKIRFDGYVVGSDQVWRPEYTENVLRYMFDFTKDWPVRRVSYAASFGKSTLSEFSESEIVAAGTLLARFDAVSVREESAVTLCADAWGLHATQMPDPTLLLEPADYHALADSAPARTDDRPYLLNLQLDVNAETQALADELATERGLVVRDFYPDKPASAREYRRDPEKFRLPAIASWLDAVRHAEFVLTDSYHATVFAMIFGREFATVGNEDRGQSRFDSLLGHFGLLSRLYSGGPTAHLLEPVDWPRVQAVKSADRVRGRAFLADSLGALMTDEAGTAVSASP